MSTSASEGGGTAAADAPFGDDEIFYGSVPVALAPAPGHCEAYDRARAALATAPEEIAVSLARANKLAASGATNVVVPCMPCVDIRQPSPPSRDVSDWPELLRQPVIKVPLLSPAAAPGVKAVASGCRSCLVKLPDAAAATVATPVVGGDAAADAEKATTAAPSAASPAAASATHAWFRLKGSGNHDQGFILKTDPALDIVQVRGCAFQHTAARENFMTAKLAGELAGQAVAANAAMGSFVYGPPHQPLGGAPTAEGVSVTPTCIVQRTLGDRRLGSHLLAGLSVLLPQVVPPPLPAGTTGAGGAPEGGATAVGESEAGGDGAAAEAAAVAGSHSRKLDTGRLTALFPALRPRDAVETDVPVTTAVLMTDHSLGVMYGAGNGLSFQMPRDAKVFADVAALDLQEAAPPTSASQPPAGGSGGSGGSGGGAVGLTQVTNDGLEPAAAPWCKLWDDTVAALRADLAVLHEQDTAAAAVGGTRSVLVYLYNRLGYDCGRFARGLHKTSRVSWGTYADAMCHEGQLHCNAHANNMVVLAPGAGPTGSDHFLSFLDLDMAFGSEDYLDAWGSGKVGVAPAEFDDLLAKENVNFMEVLVGADANLGVPATAQEYVRSFSPEVKVKHKIAYHFIRLALIKMANFVA